MKKIIAVLCTTSAFVFVLPANAQTAPVDEATSSDEAEIIVTGTLIRGGTAPVGSNALSLGESELEETAAISSNALLGTIPQVTNYFNRVPVSDLGIQPSQIQVSRPNLRNISGNSASSSATLILVDGHRLASVGVNQASIDPDLIPVGAIERVEVMTEGGSATYGADAVAGVINFITRKKFDGIDVGGHYGFAKNYWQWDANATVGKAWDNGSAYVSYSYSKSDALFGRDRDFISNTDYSAAPYRGLDLTCSSPNLAVNTVLTAFGFTIGSVNYAAPGFVANTSNRCDNIENKAIVPKAERHGALGGLNWNFGDSTSVDVRAYWGQRKTRGALEATGSVNVGAGNPAAALLPAGLTLGNQGFTIFGSPVFNFASANFSLAPLLGNSSFFSNSLIREYGANAEITHDLNDNWQIRALANWSKSDSRYNVQQINAARLTAAGSATTAATAFNPFNVINNNAALIADLLDNELAGQVKDNLIQMRLIAEGKLFDLPGGDARVAFGYEYTHDKLQRRAQSDIRIGTLSSFALTPYSRSVNSFFGELQLPLIGDGEGGSMLTVSGSGRYDKYSDFGSTFNPKIGATFELTPGFKIRGNWGTSFTAPTPVDQLGSLTNTIDSFPFVPFVQPLPAPQPLPGANNSIAIQGSRANLQPQEADTWSVGVDLEPTKGLRASVSYYDVKFSNILGTPTPNAGIFNDFPGNVLYNVNGLSTAEITGFFGASPRLSAVLGAIAGGRVVELVDFRTGNFGILKVSGIDAGLNIDRETNFGGIDFALNANIPLNRKQQSSLTSAVADQLQTENSLLLMRTEFGLDVGSFRAQATWNHNSGYKIPATNSAPVQTRVKAFNTFDLFFRYNVPSESMILKDISLTLNVSNVFDQDPPMLLRNSATDLGYANGFTLGRMFILGVSKKF